VSSDGSLRALEESRSVWERRSAENPYRYVLRERLGDRYVEDRAAFYATGEQEIARTLAEGERLGLPARRDRALDFG